MAIAPIWIIPLIAGLFCLLFIFSYYQIHHDYFSTFNIALFFFLAINFCAVKDICTDFQNVASHPGLLTAMGAIWLALVSFLLGYFSPLGLRLASKYPVYYTKWRTSGVILIVFLYTFVSFICYYLYVGQSGHISDLYTGRFEAQYGKGYLLWGIRLIFVPVLLLYCRFLKLKDRNFFHKISLALYTIISICMFLTLGLRELPLFLVVSLIVCHNYLHKISLKKLIMIIVMLIVFLVLYGQFRLYTGGVVPKYQIAEPLKKIDLFVDIFSRELSFTRVISDVTTVWPYVRPFEWGATYLTLLAMPIPRVIWAGKPLGGVGSLTNQVLRQGGSSETLGYYGFGYTPTMVGEAYLNFGWVGIIIVFIIFGVFARSAYAYIQLHRDNPSAILLYAISFWSVFVELRGGFTNATTLWIIWMISFIVTFKFITFKVK